MFVIKLRVSVVTAIALEVPGMIHTRWASRIDCALVAVKGSAGMPDISGAFGLGSTFLKGERYSTGFECHETTFRLLKRRPRTKQSMNDFTSNKLTARLETIPNQTQAVRPPIWKCRSIVS